MKSSVSLAAEISEDHPVDEDSKSLARVARRTEALETRISKVRSRGPLLPASRD